MMTAQEIVDALRDVARAAGVHQCRPEGVCPAYGAYGLADRIAREGVAGGVTERAARVRETILGAYRQVEDARNALCVIHGTAFIDGEPNTLLIDAVTTLCNLGRTLKAVDGGSPETVAQLAACQSENDTLHAEASAQAFRLGEARAALGLAVRERDEARRFIKAARYDRVKFPPFTINGKPCPRQSVIIQDDDDQAGCDDAELSELVEGVSLRRPDLAEFLGLPGNASATITITIPPSH